MARTLITGANGFTGRHLAAALQQAGHDVHALIHDRDINVTTDIGTLHPCDLTDAAACKSAVDAIAPDFVAHLAAISYVAHDSVDEMYRVNIIGTRNLLSALMVATRPPKAVLVASSANIYGNRSTGLLTEDTPLAPANDYAVSKAAVEMMCRMHAGDLPLIVARPFNYTGAGQSAHFLIPKIVDHARHGRSALALGNVDVARDFSDVRTVVDAYVRLLAEPRAIGGTFQICSGRAVTLEHVVRLVETAANCRFDLSVDPALVRSSEVKILYGSPARLEALVGQLKHVPLQETIEWMLRHDA